MSKRLNVLVVGSGGREAVVVHTFLKSSLIKNLCVAPGNDGIFNSHQKLDSRLKKIDLIPNDVSSIQKLAKIAEKEKIDITFVGPEKPLSLGIVNIFEERGLAIVGPSQEASILEGSKIEAKKIMSKLNIPVPEHAWFENPKMAAEYVQACDHPVVVKADGLAAGKGSIVTETKEEALAAIRLIMIEKKFGPAGERIIIEQRLDGDEFSFFALTDGETILPLAWARDYKPVFDNDQGPNTGGMGGYSPYREEESQLTDRVMQQIAVPLIHGCREKFNLLYKGILYIGGTFLKESGIKNPYVFEINVRMGDPEAQVIFPQLKTDLAKISLSMAQGKLNKLGPLEWDPNHYVCICATSGRTRGKKGWYSGYPNRYAIGKPIQGLENISPETTVFHSGTKWDGDQQQFITAGGRVLSLVASGKTLERARQKAYQEMEKIKFKGIHYRKDIGIEQKSKATLNRIEISATIPDARATTLKKQLNSTGLKNKIDHLWLTEVYTFDKELTKAQLSEIATMLSHPLTQKASINQSIVPESFSWVIEIGFLPGVTDNVANTIKEGVEDLLKLKFNAGENVYSSQLIFLQGKISVKEISQLSQDLINPLIQTVEVKSASEFKKNKGMERRIPKIKLKQKTKADEVNLNVSDKELIALGKKGIANSDGTRRGPLALDLLCLKTIQQYFRKKRRNPTDIELESIAQTWSEHCKHTIFANPLDEIKKGLFQSYIKGATKKIRQRKGKSDICVSVFTDNSGAIIFDKDWLITDKVETHNSPSALDPFGGAITGIVGVNRDTIGFGLGAKPIVNRYGFCFASPKNSSVLYKGKNLTQKMLSSQRIMEGVIRGVNSGGNCSGIPTPQGFLFFDKNYQGKPLVFVGTVGLIPRKQGQRLLHLKKAKPGDLIVMIGGRVGLDGIHGATFSSEAMDSGSPIGAVQIGDPITQKKLSDAIVKEARNMNLYSSITDNGAGGLSCSIAEMAQECGGCEVQLEKVPLKYPGLAPWQIWISESQERMTLAVLPQKWPQFAQLMKKRGVEATIVGKFTNSGKCVVRQQGKKIVNLEMDFLHHGLPQRPMKTTPIKKVHSQPKFPQPKNLTSTLKAMLKVPNLASFQFISQQYDHEVQGGSVIKPLQGRGQINGEATVIKPLLNSKKGIAVSQGVYPRLSQIDCYSMAACAIDTAIRNLIAVGADLNHLALLDNFCWCSSNQPQRLYQLKQAAKACFDHTVGYGTPLISGKDSMFNDFKGYDQKGEKIKISVLPTLLVSSIAVIKDVNKTVSLDLKFPGDLIYLLGETFEELGGSEYFHWQGFIGNQAPKVNVQKNKKLYRALTKAIGKELIASSISLNRGGLAIALAKAAIAGQLGINISLQNLPGNFAREDFGLFSESQGRILVTVNPGQKKKFEQIMAGNSFVLIGKVTRQKNILIKNKNNQKIIDLDLKSAQRAHQSTFKNY